MTNSLLSKAIYIYKKDSSLILKEMAKVQMLHNTASSFEVMFVKANNCRVLIYHQSKFTFYHLINIKYLVFS